MKASDISDIEILELIEARWRVRLGADQDEVPRGPRALRDRFPDKVIEAKLDKLDRRGFLEFGTSLWGCWLTDKGRAELERLRRAQTG